MIVLLIFVAALVHAAPKPAPAAVLEMSRSIPPGIQETIIVYFADGVETVTTTSNRFMPDRPEVGVFKRSSALLLNKIKALKESKSKTPAKGSSGPHDWRMRFFGQEIPDGDSRVLDAAVAVSEELNASSGWTAVQTAKAELKAPEAIFTYSKPGAPAKTEKQNMSAACRPLDGIIMCTTKMGYVFFR